MRACPAGARHFGDLGDPDSEVSQIVAERGGFDLMPEQGTKPVNKYLPPRARDSYARDAHESGSINLAQLTEPEATGFLGWLDKALDRIGERIG